MVDFFPTDSAFYHARDITRKSVRQFLIFQTLPVAATAIPDDLVDIIGGNIPASDIAQVITLTVKRTNANRRHNNLGGQKPLM
jgi:hypothetical protein